MQQGSRLDDRPNGPVFCPIVIVDQLFCKTHGILCLNGHNIFLNQTNRTFMKWLVHVTIKP